MDTTQKKYKETIENKKKKCGECKRYGDLHSSCFKVRDLEAEPDDDACDNFK